MFEKTRVMFITKKNVEECYSPILLKISSPYAIPLLSTIARIHQYCWIHKKEVENKKLQKEKIFFHTGNDI